MKTLITIGDFKHGAKVRAALAGYETDGFLHISRNGELYLIHRNPLANGATPGETDYPFSSGLIFGWYFGHLDQTTPISECSSEIQSIRPIGRNRDTAQKTQVITNHNKLLGILGVASRNGACSPEAQSAARMIAKEIKRRKDLLVGLSATEEGKFSYAAKREHRMNLARRIKTSFGRIVSRQLKVNIPDHVLAEVSGTIMSMLSPYTIKEFRGKELTDVYEACDEISGLSSCMTTEREQVCLYEENPDSVSVVTACISGKNLERLQARALVFKTDGGRRMISRIYALGDAPRAALKAWAEKSGIENCLSNEGGERLTLVFSSNDYMPYMDSFRCYTEIPEDGEKLTFSGKGEYSADSTDGTHAGNDDRCTCDQCGDRMDDDDSYYIDSTGERVCQSCFDNRFFCCEHCGEYRQNESRVTVDDRDYCDNHAPDHVTCGYCGDNISVENGYYICVEDEFYCTRHAPDHHECEECNENFKEENMVEVDGKWYCEDHKPEPEEKDKEEEKEETEAV